MSVGDEGVLSPGSSVEHSLNPPSGWHLLCIGPTEPEWGRLALQLGDDFGFTARWNWIPAPAEALTALRSEAYDAILVDLSAFEADDARANSGAGLALVRAIRGSGCEEPLILVAGALADDDWTEALSLDCEILLSARGWQSPALGATLRRAIARVELSRENHRLGVAHHRRLVRERDEAEHLLQQQHQLIRELEGLAGDDELRSSWASAEFDDVVGDEADSAEAEALVADFRGNYHELLRTYVMMGTGSLGSEIQQLAELMAQAGVSPRAALRLHLQRVESLVSGLGSRSARHVLTRADLLALELMIHLGESYHRRARRGEY